MPCSEKLGPASPQSPREQQKDRRRGNPYPDPPVTTAGRWSFFSRNSTRLQNHGGQLSRSLGIHLLDDRQELWRRQAGYRRRRGDFPGVCLEFFACVCLWLPSKLSSENADQGGTECLLQGFLAGKTDARARVLQTEILIHLCGYFGGPLRSLAFVGRIFRHAFRQSAECLPIGTSSKVRSDLVDSGLRPEQKQCQARLQRLVVREMFDRGGLTQCCQSHGKKRCCQTRDSHCSRPIRLAQANRSARRRQIDTASVHRRGGGMVVVTLRGQRR